MRSLKGRLAQLKMEEVLLEGELKRAQEGLQRYATIAEESESLLEECRISIVNVENTLDAARTVY